MSDPSRPTKENVWPERLMIRDTRLHDDMGGAGQRIYTTAGQGYEKREYIRADLVKQPSEPSGDVLEGWFLTDGDKWASGIYSSKERAEAGSTSKYRAVYMREQPETKAAPAPEPKGCHWKDCPHGADCVHAEPRVRLPKITHDVHMDFGGCVALIDTLEDGKLDWTQMAVDFAGLIQQQPETKEPKHD